MSYPILDKGSPVLVEVEFKKQAPFGALDYFDPTTPKITITDPDGVVKVTDADLVKSAVGKYYYVCQTATNWPVGTYQAKSTGGDGSYTDVTIEQAAFALI